VPRPKYVPQRPDNKALIARMKKALTKGHTVLSACALAGLPKSTHYDWMKRAEQGDKHYSEYSDAVRGGLAHGEAGALDAIRDAMPKDWRAAAWMLERRYGFTVANANDLPLTSGSENPEDTPTTREELVERLADRLPADILQAALDAKAKKP